MKKLGTPIAAGPGMASEKVGFEAAGTPLPEGRFAAGAGCLALGLADVAFGLVRDGLLAGLWLWDCGCEDCCSPCPLPDGVVGVFDFLPWPVVVPLVVVELEDEDEVEVEVVDEEEDEELDDELELGGLEDEEVVEVVVVLEVGVAAHVADRSLAPAGSPIEEVGVPGGTLTVNDSVPPVRRRTVTVHVFADAEAEPNTSAVTTAATAASAAISLWRCLTAAPLLQPSLFVRTPCGNESTLRLATEATEWSDALQSGTGAGGKP